MPRTLYPGQPERTRTRVAIVGYTDHRNLAPFSDPEWDIWFLNDLHHELPKVAPMDRLRMFQLHPWHDAEAWAPDRPVNHHPLDTQGGPVHGRDHGYVAMLADWATKIPVYLFESRPEVPAAIELPKDELFNLVKVSGESCKYFTNSISWMIGLAILEGYEEIGVYGVDMMMAGGEGSEYGYQRPSCELWMGVAMGRGITLHLPQESDLLKTLYVYGDRNEAPFRKNLRRMLTEYRGRIAAMSQQKAQADIGIQQLTGAINTLEWLERGHLPGDTGDKGGILPEPNAQKVPAMELTKPPPPPEPQGPSQTDLNAVTMGMNEFLGPRAEVLAALVEERLAAQASDSAGPEEGTCTCSDPETCAICAGVVG